MSFPHVENKEINLNGKKVNFKMANGCTGIGSRKLYLNDKEFQYRLQKYCILCTNSEELEGEHFLFYAKWRDNPWDFTLWIVDKEHKNKLLSNDWRKAQLVDISRLN